MLEGIGLQKRYGNQRAILDNVRVEVAPGTITALLGSNGCGKSTLLRALALVEPADDGSIVVAGATYNAAGVSRKQRPPWPTVTMVFQQLFLWPHLTVRRNITLPQDGMGDADKQARFDEVVQMFELAALVDRYPNEISLGQRQRVALARALAVRPRYLLLDEVTSALDVEHVTALLGYLKKLREAGLGILLVTHMIGFARDAADRVLFMSGGRIIEQGTPEILTAPSTPELSHFLAVLEASDSMAGAMPKVRAS